MTNPIEAAVAPLRKDAVDRAEKDAGALAQRLLDKLAAADWNLNTVAPRPHSYMSRAAYQSAQRLRNLYCMVSAFDRNRDSHLYDRNSPVYHVRDDERVAKFVKDAMEAAGASYDAFVAKLIRKVGDCTAATLDGNHVWGRSVLTVTKADNTVERWHTQQIVNQSKLGLLFNQWPTRKGR